MSIEYKFLKNNSINDGIDLFKKNGFLLIKNLFEKDLISNLNNFFLKNYNDYLFCDEHNDTLKVGNRRIQISINIDDVFNNNHLYGNEFILNILNSLFGKDTYVISDITCVTSLSGADSMKVHRDGVIFIGNPITPLLPPHAIGFLIPLIPFNSSNGMTRFWPGSHLKNIELSNYYEKENYIDCETELGDCILMDYRTVHTGLPNLTNTPRPLLYINYSANWYLDPNNFRKQKPIIMDKINFEKVPDNYKQLFSRRKLYYEE